MLAFGMNRDVPPTFGLAKRFIAASRLGLAICCNVGQDANAIREKKGRT
jgi:hypothetical protein